MNLYQKLQWLMRMGVDETIAERPLNRLKPKQAVVKSSAGFTADTVSSPTACEPQNTAVQLATAAAASAATVADLKAALENFESCSLKKTAAHTVFARGCETAKIMIIGDMPAAAEDKSGLPFAGDSGILLDKMMAAIGLDTRTDCYMSVLIPWRAPGGRKPTPTEIAVCLPFIKRHIELIHPDILLLFGGLTSGALLGIDSLSKARGIQHEYILEKIQAPIGCMVTFSPDYLIQNPLHKKHAWEDLKQFKAVLETLPSLK
ncbi:MAG: uracil-DNA glycosylase [Alphaproteobacteria bacterium]